LLPLGLDALDVCRVEAGFILLGVDYFSARHAMIESQTSSPYEIGLGWTVHLDRDAFVGRAALVEEQARGPAWGMVGLEVDWGELEALFDRLKLPPALASSTWRTAVPVYGPGGRRQVGQATSGVWSPTLKKNIALASVQRPHDAVGTELQIEVTVEFQRRGVKATVVPMPFFDPERKRS
jgi:aminomethyltransferase